MERKIKQVVVESFLYGVNFGLFTYFAIQVLQEIASKGMSLWTVLGFTTSCFVAGLSVHFFTRQREQVE